MVIPELVWCVPGRALSIRRSGRARWSSAARNDWRAILDIVEKPSHDHGMNAGIVDVSTTKALSGGGGAWWAVAPAATALVGIAIVLLVVPATEVCGLSLPGTIGCFAPELRAWMIGAVAAVVLIAIAAVVIGWRLPRWRRLAAVVGIALLVAITVAALIARAVIESQANAFS